MKASTLFSVTIALLLGLGVAVGAKYSGIFAPKPPVPIPPPKVRPKVVVASRNLFADYTILATDVALRDMTDEEEAEFQKDKSQFLPPKMEAAILRVLNQSVEADKPILREFLDEINLPQSINKRLSSPSMRAVNLTLPLERAAGGMIQRNEFVDVYLTTRISVIGKPRSTTTTETAAIARNLKVIVKRNMLWETLAPPDNKRTIDYTLEANVYRAALIDYAKTKGDLTLVPTAAPQAGKGKSSYTSTTQNDANSREYADEDARVEAFQRGELPVGEADLERIFNLKPPDIHAPNRPSQVEQYAGVHLRGVQTFGGGGGGNGNGLVRPNTGQPNYYTFAPIGSRDQSGTGYNGSYSDDYNTGELSTTNPAYRLIKPRDNTYNDTYNNRSR